MDRIIPAVLGVILLAMAVAILAVKDRMSKRTTDWRMVAALFVFIPLVLVARQSGWVTPDMGSKAVWILWGGLAALAAFILIGLPLAVYVKIRLQARRLGAHRIQFLKRREGKTVGRCERCESEVEFTQPSTGTLAYRCGNCGNEYRWQ